MMIGMTEGVTTGRDHVRDQRIERAIKGSVHAVAGHLHNRSTIALHGGLGDGIVASHHGQHPIGLLLPKPGATFDIGKEKRDGLFRHAVHVPRQKQTDNFTVALMRGDGSVLPKSGGRGVDE